MCTAWSRILDIFPGIESELSLREWHVLSSEANIEHLNPMQALHAEFWRDKREGNEPSRPVRQESWVYADSIPNAIGVDLPIVGPRAGAVIGRIRSFTPSRTRRRFGQWADWSRHLSAFFSQDEWNEATARIEMLARGSHRYSGVSLLPMEVVTIKETIRLRILDAAATLRLQIYPHNWGWEQVPLGSAIPSIRIEGTKQ